MLPSKRLARNRATKNTRQQTKMHANHRFGRGGSATSFLSRLGCAWTRERWTFSYAFPLAVHSARLNHRPACD